MTRAPITVCAVFVGVVRDGGFNACALAGVEAAAASPGVAMTPPVTTAYDPEAMAAGLREAARRVGAGGLVVFIGGQGDRAAPAAAAAFPDVRFSVVQGAAAAENLSSHHVRQDDSAWLAGVLAGRISRSGVVGHLSGHRVKPGLRGRAAFAAGLRRAAPGARLLTAFCGAQDDAARARDWTAALLAAGADPVFTMLNAGREGASAACRAAGGRQIGNATDWVAAAPDVFVASALARIDLAVLKAVADVAGPGAVHEYGAADDHEGAPYVGLSLRGDVDAAARAAVDEALGALRAGEIAPWGDHAGPEFALETAA